MSFEERNQVVRTALQAYTLEECLHAEQMLQEWLRDNPEDMAMYDMVSMLATVKAAAREEAPQKAAV